MKLIGITHEYFFSNEDVCINALLDNGLDRLHIRKPGATMQEMMHLIQHIHPMHYPKISLNDHHELALGYKLGGIHINSRNPNALQGYQGLISKSCHTIEELESIQLFDYVFLSPIFNSISKANYQSAFILDQLYTFAQGGIINEKVIALGGISATNIKQVKEIGFGGAALLGALWGQENIQPHECVNRLLAIKEKQ